MTGYGSSSFERNFELIILIILLGLFFLLIQSYILPLLLASSLVFLTRPVYLHLTRKTGNHTIPAAFMTFLVLAGIFFPLYLVSYALFTQSGQLIASGQYALNNVDLSGCAFDACRTVENNLRFLDISFSSMVKHIGQVFNNYQFQVFDSLTKFIIQFFMFVLGYFFLLRDGDRFMQYIKRILPLKSSHKEALLLRFKDVTLAVFIDNLFVAMLQGSLLGVGFWLFGFQAPVFWGVIGAFFALIPFIGTSVLWLPAALYLALTGELLTAALLTLYGMIVIGLSDNVSRPLLLKSKIHVHPFLILLSILGGIEVFGVFMGLFIGPMITSFLISVIQLYRLDFR